MSIFDNIKDGLRNYFKKDEPIAEEMQFDVLYEEVVSEPKQITIAKQWHGKSEMSDKAELKAFIGFDPFTTPWCAGFVNAIEKQCGRLGTGQLNARSYLKYGKTVVKPQLGDIAIFKRGNSSWEGHVAYFISKDSKRILLLGGNQDNKVCYKYYPVGNLLGYRRP